MAITLDEYLDNAEKYHDTDLDESTKDLTRQMAAVIRQHGWENTLDAIGYFMGFKRETARNATDAAVWQRLEDDLSIIAEDAQELIV